MDSASGPSTIAGNSVTMSILIGVPIMEGPREGSPSLKVEQALRRGDDHPAPSQVYLADDLRDGRDQVLPVTGAHHPQIVGGGLFDPRHGAHLASIVGNHLTTLELPGIEVRV